MIRQFFIFLLATIVILLTSCAKIQHEVNQPRVSYSNKLLPEKKRELTATLKQHDIKVVRLAQTWRLVVPADRFFQRNSSRLKTNHVPTMITLADLIKAVNPKAEVMLTGYTDDIGSLQSQLKRSKQLANTIAAYLWAQGIPYYQLHIKGRGKHNAVASNRYPLGSHFNRRVEIIFHG